MICTQLLGLECIFLKDRMSIVRNNPMQNYMFNIGHDLETTVEPSWRSEVLSLSSNDELGVQTLLGHSNDLPICITKDRQIVFGGHLMLHNLSWLWWIFLDEPFTLRWEVFAYHLFGSWWGQLGHWWVVFIWRSPGDCISTYHEMQRQKSDLGWWNSPLEACHFWTWW